MHSESRVYMSIINDLQVPFLMVYLVWIWLTTARLNWAYLLQPYGKLAASETSKYMDKWSTLFPLGKINMRLHKQIQMMSTNQNAYWTNKGNKKVHYN